MKHHANYGFGWRASRKATESCAAEFDEKFGTAYHERRMPEFLTEMTEKYGMDRCMVVLASTIQLADHDGRYYPSTKADAAKVEIPGANAEDYTRDIRMSYRVNSHPVMVNSAFRVLWQMQQEQNREKQAVAEKKSTVGQDTRAEKPSLLNRLHDKQREASNRTKQNETYGSDVAGVIVDETGALYAQEIFDGFTPEVIEQIRLAAAPVEVMPGPNVSVDDMVAYGYSYRGMLPLNADAAKAHWEEAKLMLYALHPGGTESLIDNEKQFERHIENGGLFGLFGHPCG